MLDFLREFKHGGEKLLLRWAGGGRGLLVGVCGTARLPGWRAAAPVRARCTGVSSVPCPPPPCSPSLPLTSPWAQPACEQRAEAAPLAAARRPPAGEARGRGARWVRSVPDREPDCTACPAQLLVLLHCTGCVQGPICAAQGMRKRGFLPGWAHLLLPDPSNPVPLSSLATLGSPLRCARHRRARLPARLGQHRGACAGELPAAAGHHTGALQRPPAGMPASLPRTCRSLKRIRSPVGARPRFHTHQPMAAVFAAAGARRRHPGEVFGPPAADGQGGLLHWGWGLRLKTLAVGNGIPWRRGRRGSPESFCHNTCACTLATRDAAPACANSCHAPTSAKRQSTHVFRFFYETKCTRPLPVGQVVILSPHGYFGQTNVLGMPDTGGQVGWAGACPARRHACVRACYSVCVFARKQLKVCSWFLLVGGGSFGERVRQAAPQRGDVAAAACSDPAAAPPRPLPPPPPQADCPDRSACPATPVFYDYAPSKFYTADHQGVVSPPPCGSVAPARPLHPCHPAQHSARAHSRPSARPPARPAGP